MRSLEFFRKSDVSSVLGQIVRNEATAAANRRIVEKKIELGRKLAALRDSTPSNRQFGIAVREQFDLHNSLEVAEMMRIARRYGVRPEIYSNAGWRVLVELALTSRVASGGAGSEIT
jgi:hypothetical protein